MTVSSSKVRALLKIGAAVGVLLVVMLASIGAWEVYKGTVRLVGRADADGAFDLIKCYSVKPDLQQSSLGNKVLVDQFRPAGEQVRVLFAHSLCVPAKILQ